MADQALEDGVESGAGAERALIDAAVAGEVQAFAALYDRHLARVYRYVYYLVGNRTDAEDLAQEAFLNAWRAIGHYRHTKASFIAWLLTIAHNSVISFFRNHKNVSYLDTEAPIRGEGGDPETEALARFDRKAVRDAIQRLKPEQQQVIVMRFVEELDYGDVAAALGKSEGNLRVIQHRALADLKRLLRHEV